MIHVKPIANPQDMAKAFDIRRIVFVIETKPSPPHVCDGLVEGAVEGFY